MLSSMEIYKKFFIITLLVIGSFLVWAADSNAAYSRYSCTCSNGISLELYALDSSTASSNGSSLCSSTYGTPSQPVSLNSCQLAQSAGSTGSTGNAGLPIGGQSTGQNKEYECKCVDGTVGTLLSPNDTDAHSKCGYACSSNGGASYVWAVPPTGSCLDNCLADGQDQATCATVCGGTGTTNSACYNNCINSGDPNATADSCQASCAGSSGTTSSTGTLDSACYNNCINSGDPNATADSCQASCTSSSGTGGSTGGGGTGGSTGGGGTGGGQYSLPNPLGVTSISELIRKIANFLIVLAIPFAVFMVILAGFRFATAQGNEEKLTKAKQNFIWTIAGVAIILASEALILYIEDLLGAGGGGTVNAFINKIRQTLNSVVVILFILVTIYFCWGIIQYVVGSRGDEEKLTQGKRHMIWGIVGMTVMASAWGIVQIISAFLR